MNASVDGYVQGFGYSNPKLASVLNGQKVGEWGPVVNAADGAVMVKVVSVKAPEEDALKSAVKDDIENSSRFVTSTVFNQFVSNLEDGTPVKNNLDLYYKD